MKHTPETAMAEARERAAKKAEADDNKRVAAYYRASEFDLFSYAIQAHADDIMKYEEQPALERPKP